MSGYHQRRFPGESDAYRKARNALVEAEVALRRQTEKVAAMRRALPLGGPLKEDYVFATASGYEEPAEIKFSDLFAPGQDTLVVYNFMFAPSAAKPCPMCTSFIDSLDGAVKHLEQRLNIALIARAPFERIAQHAASRGWRSIRLLSSFANSFNTDYNAERSIDVQNPVMGVFRRVEGEIYHSYSTELQFFAADPGQNQRHLDMMWPLWNVLDLTPEGRGTDWYPSLSYAAPAASIEG